MDPLDQAHRARPDASLSRQGRPAIYPPPPQAVFPTPRRSNTEDSSGTLSSGSNRKCAVVDNGSDTGRSRTPESSTSGFNNNTTHLSRSTRPSHYHGSLFSMQKRPEPRSWGDEALATHLPSHYIPLSQSLCSRCQDILQKLETMSAQQPREFTGYIPVSSLQRLDCGICQVVSYAYEKLASWERPENHNAYDCNIRIHYGQNYFEVVTLFYFWYAALSTIHGIRISCAPETPCPWQMFPLTPISEEKTTRLGCLNWALNCIERCILSHDCGATTENELPARVIDVSNPCAIHLIETNRNIGRYICLSHCWGGHQPLRATRETLSSYLISLPWASIPRTYQDAIIFTRFLGVRYLWIDSLCILQDDLNDWARESASMCSIYERSYLVIAATSAPNASCGLFMQRDRGVLDITGVTPSNTPVRITGLATFTHPENLDSRDIDWDRWPLFRRAWIFQERLLSPRVIHFCSEELYWECREQVSCECGGIRTLGKDKYNRILTDCTDEELITQWHDTVERYSLLQMSMDADKLPAISGLAKRMAKKRPRAAYLAGLWSDSLKVDLLWLNSDATSQELEFRWKHPAIWRAPSWSWAAIDSHVVFPYSGYYYQRDEERRSSVVDNYFTIKNVWSSPATSDSTGRVGMASITITGQLFPSTLSVVTDDPCPAWTLSVNDTEDKFQDEGRNKLHLDYPLDPFRIGEARIPPDQKLYCIRMARARRSRCCGLVRGLYDLYELDEVCDKGSESDEADDAGSGEGEVEKMETVEEVEYSLVVYRTNASNTVYKRIGMATQERKSALPDNVLDPSRMWRTNPSLFDTGGFECTITIF